MFNCDLEYSNWMALAVLAIVMLCQVSASCKYYAKMTVFGVVALLLSTIVPLPWFILRPRHYKNALYVCCQQIHQMNADSRILFSISLPINSTAVPPGASVNCSAYSASHTKFAANSTSEKAAAPLC